jgi:mannose-6-phosphate isomerase-like protein (cupin superfamily)
MSEISSCKVLELKTHQNRSGSITPIHQNSDVPFNIKRIFYIYDIPGGASRGAHAHKECHQFLVAVSGAFEVEIDDGTNRKRILLNRPNFGLYIPPGIWASEVNFSSGAICLALTSQKYSAEDYIRDYHEYLNYVR